MELIGGLLVLLVIGFVGLTICAGGLCTEEQTALKNQKEVTR